MAQVKLSATELIEISNLIELVAKRGKQENTTGLYIDFMYISSTQCKILADILQHISTETYGYMDIDKELCTKLRNATK